MKKLHLLSDADGGSAPRLRLRPRIWLGTSAPGPLTNFLPEIPDEPLV